MVQKTLVAEQVIYSRNSHFVGTRLIIFLFSLTFVLAGPQISGSESLASKNKKGNRLYDQGRYEDAEKAYLSAQGDDPGRPEILYNLGNSLIKQKKYPEGVQALKQSISRGGKETRERGWYNTGNALFSSGNYREAADAFIQALRLNPADRDAKHNLELALLKLKQQEQQKNSEKDQNQRKSGDSKKDRSSPGKKNEQQQSDEQKKTEPNQSPQSQGSITREQAMQLLDALKNQEIEEQRKLLERRAAEKANGKDW